MSVFLLRILVAMALACVAPAAFACGPDTNCQLGDRHYRIAMPEGHDGVTHFGAIVFAHGYRGSARGAMRNIGMHRRVCKRYQACLSKFHCM